MRKSMNEEIQKYSTRIYCFIERKDKCGNLLKPLIKPTYKINSTADYNHFEYELHHIVPFTDWEKNTKNIRKIFKNNALILLPKKMHQHLENPVWKLSKEDFERIYNINPDVILFDINSLNTKKECCLIDYIDNKTEPEKTFLFERSIYEGNLFYEIEKEFGEIAYA